MTREEAIEWLTDIKENVTENWSQDVAIDMATEALQIDVVRCKDCRYYKCGVDLCESLGDDGFCSYGERKGGENE